MHPHARRSLATLPLLMAAALTPPLGSGDSQPAEPPAQPDASPEADEIARLLGRHTHYAATPPVCCIAVAGADQRERRPRRRGQRRAGSASDYFR